MTLAATVDWSDFRVLLALSRAGSVAGGARELHVDTSTISRRLAALEEAVKAQLLIRGGREFAWTAQGRCLLEAACAMESAADAALRSLRASMLDLDGAAVRVSVAPAFMPILLRGLLPALRQTDPALTVELGSAFERVDLARGESDIAVRMARPDEPDLIARRAFDLGWFLYASAGYLERHGRPAGPGDLAGHALVLYAERMHCAAPARWLEAQRGAHRASSRVDSVEVACQVAAADGGLVVLPAFVAEAQPNLQRVFAERVAFNTGWVVYHQAARDCARVKRAADALLAFFRQHEALFGFGMAGSLDTSTPNTHDDGGKLATISAC